MLAKLFMARSAGRVGISVGRMYALHQPNIAG